MVTGFRVLFWLMLAVATQQSLTPLPMDVFQSKPDLLLHFLCWGSLAGVLYFALAAKRGYPRNLALLYLYSLAVEVAQYWVPGRTLDPRDMLANGSGILLAWGALRLWRWGLSRGGYSDP